MKRIDWLNIVFVIAEKNFHDHEYLITKRTLENAGVRVFVAGLTNNLSIGQYGIRVKPDMILSNVNSHNFSAIVLIGGKGSTELWKNSLLHKKLYEFDRDKKLVCAICSAVGILAHANLLAGKKVAVYHADAEIIQSLGAVVSVNTLETDDRIITASEPEVSREFGNTILVKLSNR
jgi:putative intracellular protease/amidase